MLKNSKERSGFALVWFLFSIAYTVVLLGTGYNFLAPFAAAIAAVTALIVFIRALFNKKFEPLFVVSYAYMILELFVYFLFWGADEFGKIVWYNLILSALPLFSGLMLYALDKKLPDGTLKTLCDGGVVPCDDGDFFVLRLLYVFENPSDRRKFAGGTRRIP